MIDDEGGRRELLAGLTGLRDVDQACRRALEAGAAFTVGTEPVSVAQLVAIYG